jgi:thioredoxin-like negative regulator of GroEL
MLARRGRIAGKWAMSPKLLTLDEFHYHQRLRQTPGKSLVLFGSPGCGACRVAESRLPEVAAEDIRLFRVDVQVSPGLARALEVFHLPALILYLDGRYHARLDCELTRGALVAAVADALDRPAEEEP